ncbi:conserved hypothetical protein [Coccidioides posadasii str. Silveira]|uniref:Uncharacterized protein n=1 Tax=Coccidioides posadasii (strain RMSCC 757 / Silveira) TaxID=443226 RepID=E9D3E2_COCPS|nr:conserved hypothetical protein [Coccidioides posadasii str. Silveira]
MSHLKELLIFAYYESHTVMVKRRSRSWLVAIVRDPVADDNSMHNSPHGWRDESASWRGVSTCQRIHAGGCGAGRGQRRQKEAGEEAKGKMRTASFGDLTCFVAESSERREKCCSTEMISPETHTSSESGTTDESWESISKTEKGTHCVVVKAANRMTISVRDNHMSPLQHGHARLRRPGSPCAVGAASASRAVRFVWTKSPEPARSYGEVTAGNLSILAGKLPVLDAVEEPQGLKGRP